MFAVAILIVGAVVFLVPGAWVLRRAPDELKTSGAIAPDTFTAAFVAYVGHSAVTLVAAWTSAWPLPLPAKPAFLIGALVALSGAALYLPARVRFRSFRLTWGLETSGLVTSGVYRFSRNPQMVGILLFQTGAAIAGTSGVALGLAALGWYGASVWVPLEEGALEKRYGEAYRRYRRRVPRYF